MTVSFHIEQYNFAGGFVSPSGFLCGTSNASDRCVQGYFTTDAIYTGELGGPDLGVVLVKLVE